MTITFMGGKMQGSLAKWQKNNHLRFRNNYFIGRNFKNAVALFVARKKSLFCPFFWSETSGND